MNLKQLTVEDKATFDSVYSKYEGLPSDLNFTTLWIWTGSYDIFWSIENECLCVFGQEKGPQGPGAMIMWGPPLPVKRTFPEDYSLTLDECFRVLDDRNKEKGLESRIYLIYDELLPLFKEVGCRIRPAPYDADYIYRSQSLRMLVGATFKQKRKELREFENRYSYRVESYASDYRDECQQLLDLWFERKLKKTAGAQGGPAYLEKLRAETEATRTALNWDSFLSIRGVVIRVSGKVGAFALGCDHSVDSTLLLEQRADVSFKGIYSKTLAEFCRRCVSTEFLNLQGDWGIRSLKDAKLRWNPERLLMTYYATKSQKNKGRGRVA